MANRVFPDIIREKPFTLNDFMRFFASRKRKNKSTMKRIVTILTAILTVTATASAMSYENAREQALFLTDKMAYELNLTEEQYDAAYEINLDYLMSINTPDDLYEAYWRQRNLDLSYILLDWQYRAFCAATYFYRPIYWTAGVWHFAVYSRYPRRNFFYFGRPNIYITYRGGHSWHHNGGHSWYKGRTFHHGNTAKWHGMRDRYHRGDYHKGGHHGDSHYSGFQGNRPGRNPGNKPQRPRTDKKRPGTAFKGHRNGFRNNRESSTRTTARPSNGNKRGFSFGGNRRTTSTTIHSRRNEEHQDHQSTAVRAHAPQWEAAGQAVAHQSLRHAEVAVAVEVTSEAGDNINATKKLMMLRHGLPSTESRRTICLPAFFMR